MHIGFESIVSYFPDTKVTADDFSYLKPVMSEAMPSMPAEKRRLADPRANEIMLVKAVEKALATASLEPSDIDLIICQSYGGRFIVPGIATFLHDKLGFRREAPAWNIQNICAGFLDACEIATNLIKGGGDYKRVLVASVQALETGGWGTDHSDPASAAMGDGAAAAIVSSVNLRGEFLAYSNETYGADYDALVMGFDAPGRSDLVPPNTWVLNKGGSGPHITGPFDHEKMLETFAKMASSGLAKATAKAGLTVQDLDLVLAHVALPGILEIWKAACEKTLGLSPARWRDSWQRYGNASASDIPAVLNDLLKDDAIPAGAKLALFAPGGGGHTPTLIMRWNG